MNNYRRRILRFPGFLTLLGVFMAPQYADAAFTSSVGGNLAATVDGDLSDWGITVADNNGSFAGLPTTVGGLMLRSYLEDTSDTAGHSFPLGPNSGGQDYDAEFMGVVINGNAVSIAIVTGQRPDNGLVYYAPGDLIIQTTTGIFGLEVGGVRTGFATTLGLDPGVTFELDSNGYTLGSKNSLGITDGSPSGSFQGPSAAQTAGSIWLNPIWQQDPIAPPLDAQIKDVSSATYFGLANYIFTLNAVTTQHSIIELTFNASGMGAIQGLKWSPSCGNDFVEVPVPTYTPQDGQAPEPSTFAIWGGIGACFIALRRRRRNRTS